MLNNIMENTYDALHVNTMNTMFSFSVIVFNMMKLLVVLFIMKLIAQIHIFKHKLRKKKDKIGQVVPPYNIKL